MRQLREQELKDISKVLRADAALLVEVLERNGYPGIKVVAQVMMEFGRLLADVVLFPIRPLDETEEAVFSTAEVIETMENMDEVGWELDDSHEVYSDACEKCGAKEDCGIYQRQAAKNMVAQGFGRVDDLLKELDTVLGLEEIEAFHRYSPEDYEIMDFEEIVSLADEEAEAERQDMDTYNHAMSAAEAYHALTGE